MLFIEQTTLSYLLDEYELFNDDALPNSSIWKKQVDASNHLEHFRRIPRSRPTLHGLLQISPFEAFTASHLDHRV